MKALFAPLLLTAALAAAPSTPAPATLSKEGDLTLVVLKPDAEQRLRLQTTPVARRTVPSTRLFAGEVVRNLAAGDDLGPVVGGSLDETLRLADAQAVADGRVRTAKVQTDAARLAFNRATQVQAAEAGSARAVEEAKAAVGVAEASLDTARNQRLLLGAPVREAASSRPLWIRTAIYSGEAPRLDPRAAATFRPLGPDVSGRHARPVAGPATANTATGTIDWYYEVPAGSALRPGERVAVEIATREGQVEATVVPFHAIVHDIHGGQWVYTVTVPHTYARRRVQVARLAGADAVLASGPAAGTTIVTTGAAELFGTEFMTGK